MATSVSRERRRLGEQRVGHREPADVVEPRREFEGRLVGARSGRARGPASARSGPRARRARATRGRARRAGRSARPPRRLPRPRGRRVRGAPPACGRAPRRRASACHCCSSRASLRQRRPRSTASAKRSRANGLISRSAIGRGCPRVALEQRRVGRREDDGRVRVLALQLGGEPETVVSRHHHVDDGEVAGRLAQGVERLVGVGRGAGAQAERGHPARHDVADGRFVVDDQDGRERGQRHDPSEALRKSPAIVAVADIQGGESLHPW